MKFDLKYRGTAFMWMIFVLSENSAQLSLFGKYEGRNHSGGQGTDGNMIFKWALKIIDYKCVEWIHMAHLKIHLRVW
jgi:hypothetical protein